MKTVAITGVNGFIGGVVAQHFLNNNWKVKGNGSKRSPLNHQQDIDFLQGRFQVPEIQDRIVENIDVLVHCAGKIHLQYGVNRFIEQVNHLDSVNLVQNAIKNGVKHIIYLSSIHAFKEDLEEISVDSPLENDERVSYNYSKAQAVQSLTDICTENGVQLSIVYPTAVIGPYNYTGTSMMKVLKMADQMPLMMVPNAAFDIVDVDDVAESILKIAEDTISGNYIIGGLHTPMADFIRLYYKHDQQKKIVRTLPVEFLLPISQILEVLKVPSNFSLYNINALKYGTKANISHQTAEILGRQPADVEKIITKIIAWKSHLNN